MEIRVTDTESSLLADIPKLNADSQAFLRWILDRVIGIGLRDYGPWDALKDTRDLDKEIADEQADTVVYTAMRAVRRARRSVAMGEAYARVFDTSDVFEEEPTGQHLRATASPKRGQATAANSPLGDAHVTAAVVPDLNETDVVASFEVRDGQPYEVVPPGNGESV